MVELTSLNGQRFILNADLIERIEARPDTIVSLTSGKKLIVQEAVSEVVSRLMHYRRSIFMPVETNVDVDLQRESCIAPFSHAI